MNLKVIVTNKTILSDGRKTPIVTPFIKTPEELIAEMEKTIPTPVFRTGNKVLTKEFLESLIDTKDKSEKELKLAVENKDKLEEKKEEPNIDSPVDPIEEKKEELKSEEPITDLESGKEELAAGEEKKEEPNIDSPVDPPEEKKRRK